MAETIKLQLPKAPTGIRGLDEISEGGLPEGRPTLITGNAGCGKTLLAMQFLYNGITSFNQNGVFISFEETTGDLIRNMASLGYMLDRLVDESKLRIDYISLGNVQAEFVGEFDLEGLFIRLGAAIDAIGASRIVLDGLESLFSSIADTHTLRAELNRLFHWLKERGVTAVVTGESGVNTLTRHGLEEYVADCVIALDHRVCDQVSMRRLRIVKYRGSTHGTDEYPFLIDDNGISVLPITSAGLQYSVSNERISTGVKGMDAMLGNGGYFVGSSILVSGTAGTGKSSLGAHLADAACEQGQRVQYYAFEESADQILRNMSSIGVKLSRWMLHGQERLDIYSSRPSSTGLEMHLSRMINRIRKFKPNVVIIDPLNSFITRSNATEARLMLLRLVDYLKNSHITGFFTSLTVGGQPLEQTEAGLSSLMDTWLVLTDHDVGAERIRTMTILKSRGMAHSHRVHEFMLTDHGIEIGSVFNERQRRVRNRSKGDCTDEG